MSDAADRVAVCETTLAALADEIAALLERSAAVSTQVGGLNAPTPTPSTTIASSASTAVASEPFQVRVVVQRCNAAELLVDNADEWVKMGWGLVIFVSFGKGCIPEVCIYHRANVLLPLLLPPFTLLTPLTINASIIPTTL